MRVALLKSTGPLFVPTGDFKLPFLEIFQVRSSNLTQNGQIWVAQNLLTMNAEFEERAMAQNPATAGLSTIPETLYSIGEAADVLGISMPTIRLYEQQGLIIPIRKSSRHRRFSLTDLDRIRCIRKMINIDKISVEGVKRMLSLIPCWKIKSCPDAVRNACPAFLQNELPCWMTTNKRWDCRSTECRVCPVYSQISDVGSLKHSIAVHTLANGQESHYTP